MNDDFGMGRQAPTLTTSTTETSTEAMAEFMVRDFVTCVSAVER